MFKMHNPLKSNRTSSSTFRKKGGLLLVSAPDESENYKIQLPAGLRVADSNSKNESKWLVKLNIRGGEWFYIAKTSGVLSGISSLLVEKMYAESFKDGGSPIDFSFCGKHIRHSPPRRVRLRGTDGIPIDKYWPTFYSSHDDIVSLMDLEESSFRRFGFASRKKAKSFEIIVRAILQHFSICEEKGLYINPACKTLAPHLLVCGRLKVSSLQVLASDLFSSEAKENNSVDLFLPLLKQLVYLSKERGKGGKMIQGLINEINNGKVDSITHLLSKYQRMEQSTKLPRAKIYIDFMNIDTSLFPYRYSYRNIARTVAIGEKVDVQGAPYGVLVQQIGKWKEGLEERADDLRAMGIRVDIMMVKGTKAEQNDDVKLFETIKKDLMEQFVETVVIFAGDGGYVDKIKELRKNGIGKDTKFIFVYVPGTESAEIRNNFETRNIWKYVDREELEV